MRNLWTEINGSRGWRRMPVTELEDVILAVRRAAEHQHLSEHTWSELDQMRSRLVKLREAGQ
jgi:hypothetical protein